MEPPTQWVRWRHPVIGMPLTPRFLGNGRLLVLTHLGQAQVIDAHRGEMIGSAVDLVRGVDPTDSQRGLTDCQHAEPRCPIAFAPAFSASLAYYDGLRRERLPAALIQGLRDNFGAHTYHRVDTDGTFHTEWAGDLKEHPA